MPTSSLATCAGGAFEPSRSEGSRWSEIGPFASSSRSPLALAFAHRQGVAHGNVGSSNILFDGEGNAYLGDFPIGSGPAPDPAEDVRELARLVERLLPNETVPRGARRAGGRRDGCAGRGCVRRGGPQRRSNPRRSWLLDGLSERNPYKGLRAFTEADARDFFGRERAHPAPRHQADEAGPGSRFLAVVGPSGGGKSSVVRAGWFRRSGAEPRGRGRIPSSPRCSRSPPDRRARGRAASDRGARPPAARPARFRISGPARGGGSRRARRGRGRARRRSVRGGLHPHHRRAGAGAVPRGASRRRRRSREPAARRS